MGKIVSGTSTKKHPEPFPTSVSDDRRPQTMTDCKLLITQ